MNPQVAPPVSTMPFVNQQHVVPDPLSEAPHKYGTIFYRLGITQMILGTVSAILGITLAVYANIYEVYDYKAHYDDFYGRIATGVWCGAFFVTSGILGMICAKKKTRCLVILSMTMAIFSSLAASTLFILEILGVLISTDPYVYPRKRWNVSAGIHSTLIVIATVELILSITYAALCCNCKCDDQQPQIYSAASPQTGPAPSHPGYVITNAFAQDSTGLAQATYTQTSLQPGVQIQQQPSVVSPGVIYQPHAYQVQQLQMPQTVRIQQQLFPQMQQSLPQNLQQIPDQTMEPPSYEVREKF